MDMGIKGRWALVCGASKGLGLGCARALALEGVHVVMVARGADVLQQAANALRTDPALPAGTQVVAVAADITTEAGRAEVLAAAGRLDILVTNAGGPPPGVWSDWSRDDFIKALDANMLTPIALMILGVDTWRGGGLHDLSARDLGLLVFSGGLTATPLILFSYATKRVKMATVGLAQYLNPTLQFLCAVVLFGEPFGMWHAVAFGLIWSAIGIYSASALAQDRATRSASSREGTSAQSVTKSLSEASAKP